MFLRTIRSTVVHAVCLAVAWLGIASAAQAGLVTSGEILDAEARSARVDEVSALLQRDDVRGRLLALGVAPERVAARLDHLTVQEIATLQSTLEEQIAGGDALALIGAVFLVLLILELVGVTNVFNAI